MPEKNDIEDRVNKFRAELRKLLGKYKLGLSGSPVLIQSKDVPGGYLIAAKPSLFDDSKSFEKSEK